MFQNSLTQKVIYVTTPRLSLVREKKLRHLGIEIFFVKEKNGGIDLRKLMSLLGMKGITSILIEGGGQVNTSALKEKIVDKIVFFFAPILIGGRNSPSVIGGEGIRVLKDALKIKYPTITTVGSDLMVEGYL